MNKLYPLFFFLSTTLFAAQINVKSQVMKQEEQQMVANQSKKKNDEMLVVSPLARSGDIKAAWNYFKKNKPTSKLIIHTKDNQYSNIVDMDVMPGGTIIIIKTSTTSGEVYQLIPIEQVKGISTT